MPDCSGSGAEADPPAEAEAEAGRDRWSEPTVPKAAAMETEENAHGSGRK